MAFANNFLHNVPNKLTDILNKAFTEPVQSAEPLPRL